MNEEKPIVETETVATDPFTPPTDTDSKQPSKKSPVHFVFDIIEMFAWSVLVVLILFSFVVRLCRVEGSSMENTLYEGENLLIYSLGYTPEQDDIIVFHQTDSKDKALVKRVIATSGQKLKIDFNTAKIYVDGVEYADTHKVLKNSLDHNINFYERTADPKSDIYDYDLRTNVLTATVPEGHVFVMGDNRNFSLDSRASEIGFVDERCILGKAVLRLSPFTLFS